MELDQAGIQEEQLFEAVGSEGEPGQDNVAGCAEKEF